MSRSTSETGSPLYDALDCRVLRRMAGSRSFERGKDYFKNGQVLSLAEYRGKITATAQGTRSSFRGHLIAAPSKPLRPIPPSARLKSFLAPRRKHELHPR